MAVDPELRSGLCGESLFPHEQFPFVKSGVPLSRQLRSQRSSTSLRSLRTTPLLPPHLLPQSVPMSIPLFILGGAPGAGKTTIGPGLAEKLNFPFFEGASLVSDEAKAAMSKGVPLSESAHTQWMDDIVDAAYRMEQDSLPKGIVTTCTALTRKVRDRLRNGVHELNQRGSKLELVIIWCNIDKEVSFRRAEGREGHYYNPAMTEWIFSRTEIPCVEGDKKEENTHLVDATQKVENVICEVLKIMEANIKKTEK